MAIMKQERTICHIAAIPTAVDQNIRNQTIFAPMGNASGDDKKDFAAVKNANCGADMREDEHDKG